MKESSTIIYLFTPERRHRRFVVKFHANPAPCDRLYTAIEAVAVLGDLKMDQKTIYLWNPPDLVSSAIRKELDGEFVIKEKKFKKRKSENLDLGELPL